MWIWVIAEVVLVSLVAKYRMFESKVMLVRSIAIEVLFLMLVTAIALVPLATSINSELSIFIVALSLFILLIDFLFAIAEVSKTMKNLISSSFKSKAKVHGSFIIPNKTALIQAHADSEADNLKTTKRIHHLSKPFNKSISRIGLSRLLTKDPSNLIIGMQSSQRRLSLMSNDKKTSFP